MNNTLLLKVLLVVVGPFSSCLSLIRSQDTAALIVGGHNESSIQTDSAELFGCPGQPGSIVINQFPNFTYLAGGIWRDDEQLAMICGGYTCRVRYNLILFILSTMLMSSYAFSPAEPDVP